ncbi:MAG: imidazolonepropionase [Methanomassiliicoccales archaeon]
MKCDTLIRCGQLCTFHGVNALSGEALSEMDVIDDGCIVVRDGIIVDTGRFKSVRARHSGRVFDTGDRAVLPAFVDPHTHLLFAGERSSELSMKLRGLSYGEILARGGGIMRTVRATRRASRKALMRDATARITDMLHQGTCSFEVKSGYGLTASSEIRMLEALKSLSRKYSITATYMGAHSLPPGKKRESYVEEIRRIHLPAIVDRKLASFCDVFVEAFAFSTEEALAILTAASSLGLRTTAHIDEFSSTGGVERLAAAGVHSLSHLAFTRRDEFSVMARHHVMGILLPSTPLFSFSEHYPDGKGMISEGVPVAIGTDLSPNSWNTSMLFSCMMAVYKCGLTVEQAVASSTLNAACAIGQGDSVGTLDKGKLADIHVLNCSRIQDLFYRYSGNMTAAVFRKGIPVYSSPDL